MPNAASGRFPAEPQASGLRATPLRVAAGVVVVVVAAVLLAGLLGGPPPSSADITAAASQRASASASAAALASADPDDTATPGGSQAPDGSQAPGGPPTPGTTPRTSPGTTAAPSPSSSVPSPVPSDGVPSAALQRRLDKLRAKLSIPGVSVAILWDDGRQWLGTSGMADVKAGRPMTTGTAFALASISKTFTAAVVLQLVEEGKLSLDQRVASLLPAFRLDRRMTVHQLLDHTSGLPDFFLNARIDLPLQRAPDATWSAAQTWAYEKKKHPDPGNLWIYSNANYLLLGQLVERVTGHPLADEVRSRLIDPLGLESTWYQAEEAPRAQGAVGYRLLLKAGGGLRYLRAAPPSDVMPFRSVVTAAGGAGSIAATALDAARWMRAYAGGDVHTPGTRAIQVADVATTKALGASIPYGLGIQAIPVAGHAALGHSGRFLGFRNVARYLPDEGITIAVLTNQGVLDPARIEEALIRIVLPPPAPSESPMPSPFPSGSPALSP